MREDAVDRVNEQEDRLRRGQHVILGLYDSRCSGLAPSVEEFNQIVRERTKQAGVREVTEGSGALDDRTGNLSLSRYEIVPRREWSKWCVSIYPSRPDLPILSKSTLRHWRKLGRMP